MLPLNIAADFDRRILKMTGKHPLWRVFSDFCEMGALAYANAVEKREDREERYLEIIRSYDRDDQRGFPELLARVIEGLEEQAHDVLGDAFMRLELSSHWRGQFFTPTPICRLMAEMTLGNDDLHAWIAERGFITVNEPASGAGATLIALVAAMRNRDINPQTQLYVRATDVDSTAAHMCFVQLSLLGIPAQVVVGNTLSGEARDVFTTPAHWMGMWPQKLRRGYALGSAMDTRDDVPVFVGPAAMPVLDNRMGQLALFGGAA